MGQRVQERSTRGILGWDTQGSDDFCGGGLLLVLLPGAPERVIFQQAADRACTASHCTVVYHTTSRIWQALVVYGGGLIPPPSLVPAIKDRVRATGFPPATRLHAVETCWSAQMAKKFLCSRDYAAAIVGAGSGPLIAHRATRLARFIQCSVPTELYLR